MQIFIVFYTVCVCAIICDLHVSLGRFYLGLENIQGVPERFMRIL